MSTAPAAGGTAAATDSATPPKKIETVPADIRRRVLGSREIPPTAEEIAKAKADKEAADKKLADETAAAEKKKADDAAAAAKAAATTPPAPTEKVRKVKAGPPLPDKPAEKSVEEVVREVSKEIARETAAGAAAPATPPLDPEVQREIDVARFAEKKHPDRYQGFAEKVRDFYAARDQLVAQKAKELGGAKSAEFRDWVDSEEFKGWVDQNRPTYQRGDRTRLQEEIIAERAREEAAREMQPKLKELERQTAELKYGPEIKAKTNAALQIIISDPSEQKDPALEGFAKDPIKFGESYPEEAQIIASEAAEAVKLIEEVYRIDRDLVDFKPEAPTPAQAAVQQFARGQNAELRQKYPNGIEMQDGKILVDADTFEKKGLHRDPRYRIFTADELAGMLAAQRNTMVLERLKRRREGIAKSIYAKPPAAASGPTGQTPPKDEDPPSPGATTRPAAGAQLKTGENKSLASRYA